MTNGTANDSNLVLHKPLYGHTVRDCCFLAITTILSSIFYISRIGFYWDDWLVLKIFHFSHDQSVIGLTRSVFAEWPEMKSRPLQALQWAVLYPLFGQTPLGYHIVSTAALLAGVCMFFSSRRRHTRWPRDWSSDVCSSDLHRTGSSSQRGRNGSSSRAPSIAVARSQPRFTSIMRSRSLPMTSRTSATRSMSWASGRPPAFALKPVCPCAFSIWISSRSSASVLPSR